jgi:hypothetical protein
MVRLPDPWTENRGGYCVTSRYADVFRIAGDYETFSSPKRYAPEAGIVAGGLMMPPAPAKGA